MALRCPAWETAGSRCRGCIRFAVAKLAAHLDRGVTGRAADVKMRRSPAAGITLPDDMTHTGWKGCSGVQYVFNV